MTPLYEQTLFYELVMAMLYGRHYAARYRVIADLIPSGATVLELCCGPGILFDRYLRSKVARYTGLDLSEPFVRRLRSRGGHGLVWNLRNGAPLPIADCVVMQGSFCHFLPDARPIFNKMLRAARSKIIVAEPVRSVVSGKNRIAAEIGRRFTDPGDGHSAYRWNEASLDQFFSSYASHIETSFLIPGGREKVFVVNVANRNIRGLQCFEDATRDIGSTGSSMAQPSMLGRPL
jgi:SAM-dependent methyltransferase